MAKSNAKPARAKPTAPASPTAPTTEPALSAQQKAELQFFGQIAGLELEIVRGVRKFTRGLPVGIKLNDEAEQGRVQMLAAAEKLEPLLAALEQGMKARANG